MDGARFDRVVRSLTLARSRRRAIAGLIAGLLAALDLDGDSEAAARHRTRRRARGRGHRLNGERKKGKKKKSKKPAPPIVTPPPGTPPVVPSPPASPPPPGPGCSSDPECKVSHGSCAICLGGQCVPNHPQCIVAMNNPCAKCSATAFECYRDERLCNDKCIPINGCCTHAECGLSHGECAACEDDGRCVATGTICLSLYGPCSACDMATFTCETDDGVPCGGACLEPGSCCGHADCFASHGECAKCVDGACIDDDSYCKTHFGPCHFCNENFRCQQEAVSRVCDGQCLYGVECCPDEDSVCQSRYGECSICSQGQCRGSDGFCFGEYDVCHECDALSGSCVKKGRPCGDICVPLDNGCCDHQECKDALGECAACIDGTCQLNNKICQDAFGPCWQCSSATGACVEGEGRACGNQCLPPGSCCVDVDCPPCHLCSMEDGTCALSQKCCSKHADCGACEACSNGACKTIQSDPGACSGSTASCITSPSGCGPNNGCLCRQAAAGSGKCGNICVGFLVNNCAETCADCDANEECIQRSCCPKRIGCVRKCTL